MSPNKHTANATLPCQPHVLRRRRDIQNSAVNNIDRLKDMLFFHDKGNVDLACALADQVDVDTCLGEGGEDFT
jgi:D-arabinose 1-dehydrogenase-like Zn-dependent alcohol dehydrogenase